MGHGDHPRLGVEAAHDATGRGRGAVADFTVAVHHGDGETPSPQLQRRGTSDHTSSDDTDQHEIGFLGPRRIVARGSGTAPDGGIRPRGGPWTVLRHCFWGRNLIKNRGPGRVGSTRVAKCGFPNGSVTRRRGWTPPFPPRWSRTRSSSLGPRPRSRSRSSSSSASWPRRTPRSWVWTAACSCARRWAWPRRSWPATWSMARTGSWMEGKPWIRRSPRRSGPKASTSSWTCRPTSAPSRSRSGPRRSSATWGLSSITPQSPTVSRTSSRSSSSTARRT